MRHYLQDSVVEGYSSAARTSSSFHGVAELVGLGIVGVGASCVPKYWHWANLHTL
jgi:hypothetical protein